MKKLVVIVSVLALQVGLTGCGHQNGSNSNPGYASSGAVAAYPTSLRDQFRRRGNYYVGPQNYYIPNYDAFAGWGSCTPFVQQPFLNYGGGGTTCLNTQVVQQFGQPAYIPNYNYGQGQVGVGPGQLCDPSAETSCGGLGACQTTNDGHAFCMQNQIGQGQSPDQFANQNQRARAYQGQVPNQYQAQQNQVPSQSY